MSKSFPRITFDTSASMNKYATNQYFHFMKKYTKKCLDPFVKEGGNGKYLFSLTWGILFNILVPFKVQKKLHYFFKYQKKLKLKSLPIENFKNYYLLVSKLYRTFELF
jgi:hypothetical protein